MKLDNGAASVLRWCLPCSFRPVAADPVHWAANLRPLARMGTYKPREAVYAVIRYDFGTGDPVLRVTAKEILWTRELAEAEVERLNHLNAEKGCRYFWQATRLYPPGTAAGGAEEADRAIAHRIQALVEADLSALAPHLRAWAQEHLISPHPMVLYSGPDTESIETLWLVTDHTSERDSSYRVIFDPAESAFGLEVTTVDGRALLLGLYGTFTETVEGM